MIIYYLRGGIMKIGILGTGMVGEAIGTKLTLLGHQVKMGSRTKTNEKAVAWAKKAGKNASEGTFSDAASFGEIVFNCTAGEHSLEALKAAGEKNLNGKILVDVANAIDHSKGMPIVLTVANTDSLGEQIQRTFPKAKVVKALNTVSSGFMGNPQLLPDQGDLFIAGNDKPSKDTIKNILTKEFGWKSVIDVGDITAARGTEMMLVLWGRLYGAFGNANFNWKVVKQ